MTDNNIIIVYASEVEKREQFIKVLTAKEGRELRYPILDEITRNSMLLHLGEIKTEIKRHSFGHEFKTVVIDIEEKNLKFLLMCLYTHRMVVDKIIISVEASSLDKNLIPEEINENVAVVQATYSKPTNPNL